MIKLSIIGADIVQSLDRAEKLGRLKNSITGGLGNFAGFIGEFCVMRYFKNKWTVLDIADLKNCCDIVYEETRVLFEGR